MVLASQCLSKKAFHLHFGWALRYAGGKYVLFCAWVQYVKLAVDWHWSHSHSGHQYGVSIT